MALAKGSPATKGSNRSGSRDSPRGKRAIAGVRPAARADPDDADCQGWAESSFDLMSGLDVTEVDDTVPADLLDKLFKSPTP